MMVMCANHLPRSWSWKSVPSRIYPSWKTRIFDRTCSQHQRLFSWSHVRSKLFTHWSWCSHWLQLRKTLQLNNTCDIICGGETRDQLYLSSRGRNQFLPSREMLLESNMFLFATRKFKIMDWIWNREFTKVWIRWRRMERWSRNSALGPVCDVQWIQKKSYRSAINQSINQLRRPPRFWRTAMAVGSYSAWAKQARLFWKARVFLNISDLLNLLTHQWHWPVFFAIWRILVRFLWSKY